MFESIPTWRTNLVYITLDHLFISFGQGMFMNVGDSRDLPSK